MPQGRPRCVAGADPLGEFVDTCAKAGVVYGLEVGSNLNGAVTVGVWEGSTLMKGYHNDGFGYEWAEVNGIEGSAAGCG